MLAIERGGREDVQELALVLVDPLDLHVEQRIRTTTGDAEPLLITAASASFLRLRTRFIRSWKLGIVGVGGEALQLHRVVEHLRRQRLDQQRGELGFASISQRRKVMPLVLLTMRPG